MRPLAAVDVGGEIEIREREAGQVEGQAKAREVLTHVRVVGPVDPKDEADIRNEPRAHFLSPDLAETEIRVPLAV